MQKDLNVDYNQTLPVTCDECGHAYFEQVVILRKASGFLTGTGKPSYIPIPVFACKSCGYVNSEFQPKQSKEL